MGTITIANESNNQYEVIKCWVKMKGSETWVMGAEAADGNQFLAAGESSTVDFEQIGAFEELIINFIHDGAKYHMALNRGHYFGGDAHHYPDKYANVIYKIIKNTDNDSKIEMKVSYKGVDDGEYHNSGDKKYLQKE